MRLTICRKASPRRKLASYAGAMLAVAIVSGALRFATRRILIGVSRSIEYDLRNAFFAHLERLPLGYFQSSRTGDLMSRATNDLSAVRMMVGPAVMYASSTGLTFLVSLGFLFSINVRLTWLALIPLPFLTVTTGYFGRVIHQRFERIQSQLSEMSAVTQEALAGVRVVRAYRQEDVELERFRIANAEYVDRNQSLIRLQAMFYPSMSLFMGLAQLIVLWLGARDVIAGRMTVGELVAFNTYLAMLSWPMIAFGWVTNLLQRGRASWQRMLEVMETRPAIADTDVKYPDLRPEDIEGRIELRDLSFAYGDRLVLENVSLRVPAGTTVAIVGRTGTGKSTLLSLLARLHDPPPGTVLVDDIDVREMPIATLRGAIGYVAQEPFLFSDTIENNIVFGATGATGAAGGQVVQVGASASGAPHRPYQPYLPHPSYQPCRPTNVRGRWRTSLGWRAMWPTSRSAIRRASASVASHCLAGRSSGRPLRALSTSIRESSCWTMRCRRWIRRPNTRFSRGCGRFAVDGRRSSCRIACRQCVTPITSSCCRMEGSPNRARTTRSSRMAACMPSCIGSNCSKRSWRMPEGALRARAAAAPRRAAPRSAVLRAEGTPSGRRPAFRRVVAAFVRSTPSGGTPAFRGEAAALARSAPSGRRPA